MTQAVYHSKSLFLVQTTHSAHIGTPFVLQGVTWFLYTVEKIHNRSEKIKNGTLKWFHVWTASFSDPCPWPRERLKAVVTLGHNNKSHVHRHQRQAEG